MFPKYHSDALCGPFTLSLPRGSLQRRWLITDEVLVLDDDVKMT